MSAASDFCEEKYAPPYFSVLSCGCGAKVLLDCTGSGDSSLDIEAQARLSRKGIPDGH
jgi:hypothetical protein